MTMRRHGVALMSIRHFLYALCLLLFHVRRISQGRTVKYWTSAWNELQEVMCDKRDADRRACILSKPDTTVWKARMPLVKVLVKLRGLIRAITACTSSVFVIHYFVCCFGFWFIFCNKFGYVVNPFLLLPLYPFCEVKYDCILRKTGHDKLLNYWPIHLIVSSHYVNKSMQWTRQPRSFIMYV